MSKTWLITGANSGIGKLTAQMLISRGDRVAALVRRPDTLDAIDTDGHDGRLLRVPIDLEDDATIGGAVNRAFEAMGHIDVVLSNAGYGTFGAIEELSARQIRLQVETNLIGTMLLVRAVLPHMRRQGGGRIIQVSSEGGRIAYPGFSTYHASKWGQEGFIEAVAQEVAPFGIAMCLVEPGPTGTNFRSGLDVGQLLPAYADGAVGTIRTALEGGGFNVAYSDATLIAQAIVTLAETVEMPLRAPMGSVAWDNIHRQAEARLALLVQQKKAAYACDAKAGAQSAAAPGGREP
jgi:NAD(P)-dependent dehydrogenase (short-subunit alcohol dehydrogenase family)